jgi:hypothetical protein
VDSVGFVVSVVELEFFDGNDPNGSGPSLGTLTDEEISAFSLRVALRGLGAGSFSIPRSHPSAASFIQKGNYVRVTIPSIQAEPVWGFWLWEGKYNLLDTQGDDTLTFSGPGPLGILRDAILLEEIFAPGQPRRGNLEIEGYWGWNDVAYGGILVRVIEEGQYQTGFPLSPVTLDFDRVDDSDGNPWPIIDNEYQIPILSNALRVFEQLREAGDLFVFSDPDFLIQAHQTFGVDRTSTTFAAGKVLLNESNILTGLAPQIHATSELTHIGLRDRDGIYSTEVHPSYTAERARWGGMEVGETNDPGLVTKIGQEALLTSSRNTDAFELEVTPGNDEAIGRYLPWLHYNVGDTVTVDAGTGLYAYENADARIVGFRIDLDEAADDSTTDTAHRSLHTVLEFNAATSEGTPVEGREVTEPGCRCLELCRDSQDPMVWVDLIAPAETAVDGSAGTISLAATGAQMLETGPRWSLPIEILVKARFPTSVGDIFVSFSDGLGWAAHRYYFQMDQNGTLLFSGDGAWTAGTEMTSNPDEIVPNADWWWLRYTLTADDTSLAMWLDGDPEPAPILTNTDNTGDPRPENNVGQIQSFRISGSGLAVDSVEFVSGLPCSSITDTFTRTEADGWGTSEFVCITGTCIHGGPAATSGDPASDCGHKAAPCDHDHDYVAAGGTAGQVLTKSSATDWDTGWSTPASVITDHGGLGGLADDDHPQYATNTEFDNHDARHANGGPDELQVESLPTAETDTDLVLRPDGGGGVVWGSDSGSPGGGSGITVEDEGTPLTTDATTLDFVGAGVTATGAGSTKTITIPGGGLTGLAPYAYPLDFSHSAALTTFQVLPFGGGSLAVPMLVAAPMELGSVEVRNLDASGDRVWGWDLYVDTGANSLNRVAQSSADESFTATVASNRNITASGAPVSLDPGVYWLVIQNRHAVTGTFGVGTTAQSGFLLNNYQTKTTGIPNGATLDFVAATWTKVQRVAGVALRGRVFGSGADF